MKVCDGESNGISCAFLLCDTINNNAIADVHNGARKHECGRI